LKVLDFKPLAGPARAAATTKFVNTIIAQHMVAGREAELVRAAGIAWPPARGGHIKCPYPNHGGEGDWRLAENGKAVCSCNGQKYHSVFDVLMFLGRAHNFEEAKIVAVELLGQHDKFTEREQVCTLAAYAAAKKLPVEFLQRLGLSDGTYSGKYKQPAVRMPYFAANGTELAPRWRVRIIKTEKKQKTVLNEANQKTNLYGLNRLADARQASRVFLVGGESDAQTLWFHALPAIGLPGEGNWADRRGDATALEGIAQIIAVVEPDQGGQAMIAALQRSAVAPRVSIIRMPTDTKDVSALHIRDPESFDAAFAALVAAAELLPAGKLSSQSGFPPEVDRHAVSLADFYAYMPQHNYIYTPARATWPAGSVNARIPPIELTDENGAPVLGENDKPVVLSASAWLDRFKPVEQMTWAPGFPMVICDRPILDGGWIERPGVSCFNLYQPPAVARGDPGEAGPWIDLIRYVFPDAADHLIQWFAHRVQRPEEKVNHAIVLGGPQGIGKDTLLEPVKRAIGAWNFQEVSPTQILGRFNGFLKSVILRISEARDLGEFDRFKFYDHLKSYIAAPPDMLRVDEKNLREYLVVNCCGVVITTNPKTDGIYLPSDDRRHFVAWSDRNKEDERFADDYWPKIWTYYAEGGLQHVGAYLRQCDISGFDAKAPPPKTAAFWTIADANRAPEEAELADLLDQLGNPKTVTLHRIQNIAEGEFADWLRDRRNRRAIPHRLEKCGYTPVRNPDADDGLWKIQGKRQVAYAQASLALADQIRAVRQL
jgi:hypothetical protein